MLASTMVVSGHRLAIAVTEAGGGGGELRGENVLVLLPETHLRKGRDHSKVA